MSISENLTQFEKIAPRIQGLTEEWSHPERGPTGAHLKTRVLVVPGDPERWLISISGTHGPEFHAGSMIQTEILRHHGIVSRQPTQIFIHGLNPFGAAWVRRCNHQGIDLNRNAGHFPFPDQHEFRHYETLLRSQTPSQFWLNLGARLPRAAHRGFRKMSDEICRGQSTHPDLLFFAGTERAPELHQLASFLCSLPSPRRVAILDLHTGLGPRGEDSLFIEGRIGPHFRSKISQLRAAHVVDLSQGSLFYHAQGTLGLLTTECFPQAEVCHITQEFGTHPTLRVLRDLTIENSAWHRGEHEDRKRAELLLETFFPDDPQWRQSITEKGFRRHREILSWV